MTFTGITKDNYKAFQPLLSNLRFDDNRIFTGVIQDDRPVGAAVFSAAEDVLCLVWIYVPEEYRRQGIADQLLDVFCRFGQARLAFLTLEVRPSNTAAVALYEKHGFREAGRRKNYYENPTEDALLLTKEFKP